jgi:hypothetical protein
MDALICYSANGHVVGSGTSIPAGCVLHDGLLWTEPDTHLATWHEANSLARNRIAGGTHWRLPTAFELASIFRSGLSLHRGWPRHFFWSLTAGANGAHYLVHPTDAEIYVHDHDDDLFCCTLVRRLPVESIEVKRR